jgi:hypothetical protein
MIRPKLAPVQKRFLIPNSILLANSKRGDKIRGDQEKGLSMEETKRYFSCFLIGGGEKG